LRKLKSGILRLDLGEGSDEEEGMDECWRPRKRSESSEVLLRSLAEAVEGREGPPCLSVRVDRYVSCAFLRPPGLMLACPRWSAPGESPVDGRQQVPLLLLLIAQVQDVVRVAAELERHEGPAQLAVDDRGHHRAEAHAAVVGRGQHPPEPGLPSLLLQRPQLLAFQAVLPLPLPAQHLRLQRHDLPPDEGAHPVTHLQLLGAQREVQPCLPALVNPAARRPRRSPGRTRTKRRR
jgi:hypothetical protein